MSHFGKERLRLRHDKVCTYLHDQYARNLVLKQQKTGTDTYSSQFVNMKMYNSTVGQGVQTDRFWPFGVT